MIAAGGTGGHIFPGLAVAGALRRSAPDARIRFLGTARGLETQLIPEAGYELDLVDMAPFVGRTRAAMPLVLGRAGWQARRLLRQAGATAALGMGGYASAPLIVGARLAGVPAVIHESGAVPGKANALSARLTRHVAVAFPATAAHLPGRPRVLGMPLPPELAGIDRAALRAEARAALAVPAGVRLLLVSGGSLGATRLDEAAVALAARWRHRDDVHILLKPGRGRADEVVRQLEELGAADRCRVVPFLPRMDHAYAAADLALTRGGAGTVAEVAVAGLPAIIVPYPHHADAHQAVNAEELVAAGGAVLVDDADATVERLAPLVEGLLDDARLAAMGAAARTVARPHAADELAAWVLELAAAGGGAAAAPRPGARA